MFSRQIVLAAASLVVCGLTAARYCPLPAASLVIRRFEPVLERQVVLGRLGHTLIRVG